MKLEKRTLADGSISLYLNYYLGREEIPLRDEAGNPVLYETGPKKGKPKYKVTHQRKKEYLDIHLLAHPRKPADKEYNRQMLALAEKIRFEKEQQFKESQTGYRIMQNKDVNFYLPILYRQLHEERHTDDADSLEAFPGLYERQ